MRNLDVIQAKKTEIMNKMNQAIKDGNDDAFAQAFTEFAETLQEAVLAEAKGLIQAADNQVLVGRGVRALTSTENSYYQKVIDAMKSGNPQQALTGFDDILPVTVIEAVFEDLVEAHPLLDVINFQNTNALIEIIVNSQDGRNLSTWGPLCSEIIKEISSGFMKIKLDQKKLSAFLPICKAMLELGPAWLDRYVRVILAEALYNGLEDGIVSGDGLEEPIGMRVDPNSPLDPVAGHALLPLIPLTQITPESYVALIAPLTVSPNGLNRVITSVVMVVNPIDYLLTILPATIFQKPDGSYVRDVFPFPTTIIQSSAVPQGEAVLGLPKKYFMGIGTSKGGKIEYSDDYRFLEDERVYLIKLYGTGRPLDGNSFLRLDISNLERVLPAVTIDGVVQTQEVI